MAQYAAAVDQGTTSTRFMIFDHGGQGRASTQEEHDADLPEAGVGGTRPDRDHGQGRRVIDGALEKTGITASDLAAVGVTNQRETSVVWDRKTGEPVYNAIVWQDTRTDKICSVWPADGGQDRFRDKTGLPLATYFSGPKIAGSSTTIRGAAGAGRDGRTLLRHHRLVGRSGT